MLQVAAHLEDFLRGQLPEFLDRRLQLAFERAVLRLNVSQPQNLRGYILDPPVFRGVALATRASLRGSQAVGGEDGALHRGEMGKSALKCLAVETGWALGMRPPGLAHR